MRTPFPPVGTIVHVRGSDLAGDQCVAALMLRPGPVVSALRLFTQGQFTVRDDFGDVRHMSDPRTVPNPDGTSRELATWHTIGECAWLD